MKPIGRFLLITITAISFLYSGCSQSKERATIRFTTEWKFKLDDSPAYMDPDLDDGDWRELDLPHDWSIEGEFSEKNPATPGGGALPGGVGWYRKTFMLDEADREKLVYIDFDGVYMKGEVWINGHNLGMRPYGYSSFRYEMTPWLNYGDKENVLAVRVDNSEQPNSRWYSGSGIYRNVWLVKTGKLHVAHWGTYITTPEIHERSAKISIETTIENELGDPVSATLKTTVMDASGKQVAQTESPIEIDNDEKKVIGQQMEIMEPELWDTENPVLYTCVSEIFEGGKLMDTYETRFGIRYFHFDPYKGFSLNGKSLKIKGVCQHHDLGCLGSAINRRALERQLEILKEMGCNSIRTSHNPPAPELLELCDEMGFLVQDETFDMWRKRKTPFDYALYFPEWHERDLTDHVLRDRNHPSVFMWSIGNEVLEQWDHVRADTLDVEQANFLLNFEKNVDTSLIRSGNLSVNSLLTIKLYNIVKGLDDTRPVTAGCNEVNPWNNLFKANVLDVYGFNYHIENYENFHEVFPGKNFIVSEATSGLMTRGFYEMPSDTEFIWPVWGRRGEERTYGNPEQQCSSYDNCHVPWGSTHEASWKLVKKFDHIAGTYIWTGFDYIGEPTPYWWPSRSSYFGIIDLAGFPKDVYYMYQSEWTDKDVLHLFPHWNWEPGQLVDVWVYTSAEEVELFLNGRSLGTLAKSEDELHLVWQVEFEPGTLKAVARAGGETVLEAERITAGEPARILLYPDRDRISADGYDLSFVTVSVVDENNIEVPYAGNQIQFEITENASIFGVDNGNPVSHEAMKGTTIKAFNGKCLVVVKAGVKKGRATLTATAGGLEGAEVGIVME